MGLGQSLQEKAITRALGALGLPDSAAFLKIGRDGLAKFTHHQLFECSKRLGQKGTAKLGKSALAERIWEELTSLLGPDRGGKGASTEKPVDKADRPGKGSDGKTTDPSLEVPEPAPISHKFELGSHGTVEESRDIPWTYGYDRVTGMAVDPDRLFVYWDVTDQSIERARSGLGASGKDAWLNLRVYDSTGRIFDGTNAHSYFDHGLDRRDRQWFFHIGKPASSAFVDVGLKSHEGYFIKIARSGRIDFPRREIAPFSEAEWLSVRSTWGPVEHAGRGLPGRGAARARGPAPGGAEGGPPPAPRRHVALLPWEESMVLGEGSRAEVVEWEEHFTDGHSEFHRQTSWESPVTISSWEAGPFTHPVEAPEAIRQAFVGPTRVYRVGGRTHVVHGPWQVVIRGLGAHYGRAVVARWEIYKSWIADEVKETHVRDIHPVLPPGASELRMGASERRWRYASEARLGGASEVFYLGASEVKARGASERMYLGASQYMMRGASERRLGGASEVRLAGASERMLAGASESRLAGASERRLGGASEARPRGASEVHFLGASEARLADAQVSGDGSYPSPDSIGSKPPVKE